MRALAAEQGLAHAAGLEIRRARRADGAAEATRERASAKKVSFNVVGERATAWALAEDVRRIVSNLLENAVKYTPEGGEVRMTVENGEAVRVCVEDSGIGIAKADQERVFDGFYRTDTAKATGEAGTGLGLSIVRQLTERWGGSIELESEPGKGTRISVRLPTPDTSIEP